MKKAVKTVVYDDVLGVEAYRFQGLAQPFPSHFHEYYVIGLVEEGERCLTCQGREYALPRGDILLFDPGDSHGCVQTDGGALDYRALELTQPAMLDLAGEVTGRRSLPGFSQKVVRDEEAVCLLRSLHQQIIDGSQEFDREEQILLLLSLLIGRYGQPFDARVPECREEVEAACAYMQAHYAEPIALDQLCRLSGLSRSTLLRAFARSKGVTPYRYLENIRISAAKKLLEQGSSPVEAAMATGFSDQSHFTRYFSQFLGLSPGVYRDIFGKKGRPGGKPHGA